MTQILKLTIAQLKAKPFNTFLSILMFAIGVAIISVLIHFENHLDKRYKQNLAGVDLVVGAKGSPLQLILSSVLHVDNPTGNIDLKDARIISKNPMVEKTIPIALGDNYKGFRIVGTDSEYVKLYQAKLQLGKWNEKSMDVVLGAEVAKKTNLKVGDVFSGVHGFMEHGHHHDKHKYIVTGILQSRGLVIDRLILTQVESVWEVHHHNEHDESGEKCTCDKCHDHEHTEEHEHGDNHHHEEDHEHHKSDDHHHHDEIAEHQHKANKEIENILEKVKNKQELTEHEFKIYNEYNTGKQIVSNQPEGEITALLVKYRNPGAATMLPRLINENTSLQAASPALELNRLMSVLGYGFDALRFLAWAIIFFSGFNVLVHLLNTLNQGIFEIALLRALGLSRIHIFMLMLFQGILLALLGWITGIILSHGTFILIAQNLKYFHAPEFTLILNKELFLLVYTLIVGVIAAIIPSIKVYNYDIHFLLNKI